MKRFKQFIDYLVSGSVTSGASQTSVQPVQNSAPTVSAAKTHPAQSGHIQQKKISIQPVNPNGLIDQSEERWVENGGLMEGHSVTNKAISASGQIVDIDKLEIQCHVCGRLDDSSIRSDISHLPLCRICQRTFVTPDGSRITVTPNEYERLAKTYDTWAAHDFRRNGVKK